MRNHSETLSKAERLCGIKTINSLFENGRYLNLNHFRVVYLFFDTDTDIELPPARILISIPKRYFKKAVIRNLLKRRIREAFRKSKYDLNNNLVEKNRRIDIAIVWTGKTIASYAEIDVSVKEMIKRLTALK